jgi:hypothetical protein
MAGLVDAPLKGGFNQGGGGYYLVLSTVSQDQILTYSGGSGSGGSFVPGSFAAYSTLGITYTAGLNYSTPFSANRLIKDMGKTVVSAGRTFRKFQGTLPLTVANTGFSSPSFGVNGNAGTSTQPGYLTAYLEVSREGSAINTAGTGQAAALIVRYA